MSRHPDVKASTVVRAIFGTATVLFFALALMFGDARLFAISGTCGLIWWIWDLILDHVLVPLADWLHAVFVGGALDVPPPGARPSLNDTIRLLEGHLQRGASRQVDINSAIRLEEIYRTVKNDPASARRVIDTALERYPDAPELQRFREGQ